jgi:hypothetical protein
VIGMLGGVKHYHHAASPYSFHYIAMKAVNMPTCKSLKSLVGASGFEPEASCAQDRLAISCKSSIFNRAVENTNLSFMGEVWLDVARCTGLIVGSLQKSLHLSAGEGSAA